MSNHVTCSALPITAVRSGSDATTALGRPWVRSGQRQSDSTCDKQQTGVLGASTSTHVCKQEQTVGCAQQNRSARKRPDQE